MRRDRPTFDSEAALCLSFTEEMARQGWTIYHETDDWDVLLVREGLQVGVQAKLKPNIKVLSQCAKWTRFGSMGLRGPQYIAILLPYSDSDFEEVARVLGYAVICPVRTCTSPRWSPLRKTGDGEFVICWPTLLHRLEHERPHHFDEPAWTPPFATDTPAGVASPVRLTAWKVQALRLLARLELRGYVTGKDFKEVGLSSSRWYHYWLIPTDEPHHPMRWIRAKDVRLANDQHPEAFKTAIEQERRSVAREQVAEQTVLPIDGKP